MYTIKFDKNNPNWSKHDEWNLLFLRQTERYLHDLIRVRGYLYMNQIYEMLDAQWNPDDENKCLRYDKNSVYQFQFEVFRKKNKDIFITILLPEEQG